MKHSIFLLIISSYIYPMNQKTKPYPMEHAASWPPKSASAVHIGKKESIQAPLRRESRYKHPAQTIDDIQLEIDDLDGQDIVDQIFDDSIRKGEKYADHQKRKNIALLLAKKTLGTK